jgi:pimeloyl-ACP methyl ester carboxylesterase
MSDDLRRSARRIAAGDVPLEADVAVVTGAPAVVLFAHGSGSSRHSPRNRYVAAALNAAGLSTVLIDLLTPDEDEIDERTRELRFDIPRLAARLVAAVDALDQAGDLADVPVALFGASTGAAGALGCAAERPDRVLGVVSRGGRPDLAGAALDRLTVPVVLIVGSADATVLDLNREAAGRIAAHGGRVELRIVPGATHLFEEPGALDAVVELSVAAIRDWTG